MLLSTFGFIAFSPNNAYFTLTFGKNPIFEGYFQTVWYFGNKGTNRVQTSHSAFVPYSIVFISEFQGQYNQGGYRVSNQQRAKFSPFTLNVNISTIEIAFHELRQAELTTIGYSKTLQ